MYIKATAKDAEAITRLVQKTIKTVYPEYYPKEVVDFFLKLHSYESIAKDIEDGLVGILVEDDVIVGTGCYRDNHITRVYVDPEFQNQGFGSCIMQYLENEIAKTYDKAVLDSSLPASRLYQNRGYRTITHEKYRVENGVVLVYEVMEKTLDKLEFWRFLMNDKIQIKEERITAEEYIDFLKRTDLGSQYPKERFEERIKKLVKNVSVSLVARNENGRVVGVLFGLTDFAYWLYVTDLGVDRDYEGQGIGRQLMKTAHEIAGGEKDIAVYLIANENAIPFYEKLGMKKADDVMQYNKIEWTDFEVK